MHVWQRLGVSERKECRVLGQARSTQRRIPKRREDEEALRQDVVKVARRFGRYGYQMVTGMLRTEGWAVNHKRVERIWRQEGLKVPSKQPKRGRLWLTTAPVSDCGPCTDTMYGRMTSCPTGPTTDGH